MQSGLADSLRTECIITNDTLAGEKATGNNVNYNYEATVTQNAENANVTLNTDMI